ncbi:hypothetical protein JCM12107_04730 [Corynebacterium simulans]
MKVPYHSHTNPEDEIAQAAAQIRHAELRFWREHLPEFDNEIELAVQRMFSATGVSPRACQVVCVWGLVSRGIGRSGLGRPRPFG